MVFIITQNGCNEIQPWSKHMILLPLFQMFSLYSSPHSSHQPPLQSTAPLLQAVICFNLLHLQP